MAPGFRGPFFGYVREIQRPLISGGRFEADRALGFAKSHDLRHNVEIVVQ